MDRREVKVAKKPLTEVNIVSKPEKEGDYGCCGFRPRGLQCLNNVRAHVLFHVLFNFFEGFVVNGVINVIIVALETRYKLSSIKSGLIASGNDFGAFPFLLFVGFFMEGRRKPRYMASGVLVMALGCLLFVLPHFLGGKYTYTVSGGTTNSTGNLCAIGQNKTTCDQQEPETTSDMYPFFLIGQVLLGVGAVPMFTVGLTYIDENTKPKMTSFYTGIIFASAACGVAVGYVTGGQTLSLFVDIDTVDTESVLLTASDPQWVGAWWIGVLVSLAAFMVIGIPIMGYPRHMPGKLGCARFNALQNSRVSEVHDNTANSRKEELEHKYQANSIRDFPKSVVVLVRNPAFVLLCLSAAFDSLIITGTATFGTKLLQQFFGVDLPTAGTIMGGITVPGAGGGMLLGGWIVKRWSLSVRGIMRMCMTFTLLSLLLSPAFFAHCTRKPMAGVDRVYPLNSNLSSSDVSLHLTSDCNADCNCDTQGMEPVCYRGSTVFFSPCHAGCASVLNEKGTKSYFNCQCTLGNFTSQNRFSGAMPEAEVDLVGGSCAETCVFLYVFCFLFFLIMVFTFATMSPNITAVMRCVPFNQRSQAVGLQLLTARGIGTTPGPVLFGVIVDSACVVWQESACGSRGQCWLYDQQHLALYIMAWWIGLKLCGAACYGFASLVYNPPERPEEDDEKEEEGEKKTSMVEHGL
ncbi:solute carrier organic anion transporter family member 4A1-like [Littorina saxatilis]|uniref:solute carrier organic anion transporter family member 4A1-like n=1 Tax=Littorina saxatilis TaxID=31220 RepID=UPI0038B5B665